MYSNKLKIIKKWIFRILLDQEAFFVAKYFNMKLTQHDKNHIKVWFPVSSSKNWLDLFASKWLWYVLIDKTKDELGNINYIVSKNFRWNYYNRIFQIDLEDYELTKSRILWLFKFWLEEKKEQNFLLKDKIEELYMIVSQWLIKMPKIERRYFREKIEKLFMDLLVSVYQFMYIKSLRKALINDIINFCLVIREMTRFLYKIGKIKNDNAFLQTWERRVEILKITKTIQQKYNNI